MSTSPFLIRLATPEDASAIQAIYLPHVLDSPTSFEIEPPSVSEIEERIVSTLTFFPWLVCIENNIVVGYAYASKHRARAAYDWSVEVSVYIARSHQRRGVGRALYTELFTLLAEQGFYVALAGITLPNPASVGLHESLGFTPIGIYQAIGYKMSAWHDVGWWQKMLQSPSNVPPMPPRGIQSINKRI
jgi:L-amino acid N-acyltransferase YncA